MDDRTVSRLFTELDSQTVRLENLAEIVHTNAAVLGIVTKLVVGIICIIFSTGVTVVYKNINDTTMIGQIVDKYHKYAHQKDGHDGHEHSEYKRRTK